jgi:Na+-transporting methylmalonyl-CoA/oxaloacetate decarboxylase beta subunit
MLAVLIIQPPIMGAKEERAIKMTNCGTSAGRKNSLPIVVTIVVACSYRRPHSSAC